MDKFFFSLMDKVFFPLMEIVHFGHDACLGRCYEEIGKVSGGTMTYYSLLFRDRSLMDQIHWWYFGMFVTCLRGNSSLSEWNLFAKIVMWWCTCFLSASLVPLPLPLSLLLSPLLLLMAGWVRNLSKASLNPGSNKTGCSHFLLFLPSSLPASYSTLTCSSLLLQSVLQNRYLPITYLLG